MKKSLKLYLAALFILLFFIAGKKSNAQGPDWKWAKSMGSIYNDAGLSTTLDPFGNIYATGYFTGTVDFDPGPGIFNLSVSTGSDVFISKFDSSGNFIWARAFGGPMYEDAFKIAIDPSGSGSICIAGSFMDTVDFDPGMGVTNLVSSGYRDIFICKLDLNGNFIWAKRFGGTDNDAVRSMALDAGGNIYTTGKFGGTADFDPGTSTYNLISVGWGDVFVSKLSSSGNFIWAKGWGGSAGNDNAVSISLDAAGNVYTTGTFAGTADFDPGTGIYNLTSGTSPPDVNCFISKLSASGSFIWAKAMVSTSSSYGSSLDVDALPGGNVYVTGYFSGTADFDPGSGLYNLTAAAGASSFILKLTNAGNFSWAKKMDGSGGSYGDFIALNPNGNGELFILGDYAGTSDLDPGIDSFRVSAIGMADIFITKLDASGNFEWAKSVGGIKDEIGLSMDIDVSGNIFITGYYSSPSIAFGFSSVANADTTGNYVDVFVAKLDHVITGIENIKRWDGISVYPNPVKNELVIQDLKFKIHKIELYNLPGDRLIEEKIVPDCKEKKIDMSLFAAGIYFVKVYTHDGFVTMKVVKE